MSLRNAAYRASIYVTSAEIHLQSAQRSLSRGYPVLYYTLQCKAASELSHFTGWQCSVERKITHSPLKAGSDESKQEMGL